MAENELFNKHDFILNYSSASNLGKVPLRFPENYSGYCNPNIEEYIFGYGVKYGWQIWDFVNEEMCKQLIKSNVYEPR